MKKITIKNKQYNVNSVQDLYEIDFTLPQKLAEEFLKTRAVYLVNEEVEYILKRHDYDAPFTSDDITNNTPTGHIELYRRPEIGIGHLTEWVELTEQEAEERADFYDDLGARIDELSVIVEERAIKASDAGNAKLFSKLNKQHNRLLDQLDRIDNNKNALLSADFDDYPGIMQWLFCPELIHHLEKRGECTLDGKYWGRTTYGQSIILDSVIQEIAFDILSVEVA